MEKFVFDLTETLAGSIIFAMEDQSSNSLVDAQHGCVVSAGADDCVREDGRRYYSIPSWTPGDGFSLMEEFASSLHVPQAREALIDALHSGRGVFRNFKSVLKLYPAVEKKWLAFKNKRMRRSVNDWYNGLREFWGLEKLNRTVEDTEDLLHDDFSFREYRPSDAELLASGAGLALELFEKAWPPELVHAVLAVQQNARRGLQEKSGFVCHSVSSEFAGCIAYACPEGAKNAVLMTDFFVTRKFRGLGVGRELLMLCMAAIKSRGISFVIIADLAVPELLLPLLDRTGFTKFGSGFIARLH